MEPFGSRAALVEACAALQRAALALRADEELWAAGDVEQALDLVRQALRGLPGATERGAC